MGFIGYAALLWAIYREWLKLGGDKGYKAPELNSAGEPESPA